MTEKNIKITEQNIDIPLEQVIIGRNFITGKSGSGKSNTLGKTLEEILEQNLPFLIVDTEGEYHGLKQNYEVLHVGAGEECELQVSSEHSEKIAELVLKQDVPVILDISEYFDKEEAQELVKKTLRTMYEMQKNLRKPTLIVIEEGHEFIPETGYTKKADYPEVAGIIVRIVKRGRKRGLGIALASQRPASVDTDYITQCNWRVWHKQDWKNDLQVVKDVLEKNKPRSQFIQDDNGKTWSQIVADMNPGEAILEADFLDPEVQQVKFLRKQTFDFGETPSLDDYERPELKTVSSDLVEELQEISENKRQEKSRIEQLESKLEKKDHKVEELQEELARAKDMTDMAQQLTQALTNTGDTEEVEKKVDEIREQKNKMIRDLESENEELNQKVKEIRKENKQLSSKVEELEDYEQAIERMDELREAVTRMSDVLGVQTSEPDEKIRDKIQKKDEKIQDLEAKVEKLREQGNSIEEEFKDKMDFLKHEAVTEEISNVTSKTSTKSDHTWDVLSVLVDQDRIQKKNIVPYVDVSESSVANILSKLQKHNIVEKEKEGKQFYYKLNTEGMEDIIKTRKKRDQISRMKNKVRG